MSFAAPSADPTADLTGRDKVTAAATASAGPSRCSPSSDERCVHLPRRDRDEPDAANATVSSSSSSSSTAAATSTRPEPIALLYRHALECILAFSDAKTLMAALRVSKEWLAAVGSMRALAFKVTSLRPPAEAIASSAIGRHLSELDVSSLRRMSPDALGSLTRLMPRLRCLRCRDPLVPTGANLHFPAGLRELQLIATNAYNFTPAAMRTRPEEDDSNCAASFNVAIAAAGRLMQLGSLFLSVCRRRIDLLTFGPLAALPLLRHLDVFVFGKADPAIGDADQDDLTDARVDELRALPRLHSLDVKPISTALLRRLLAQPHELQWKQISPPHPQTDADAALLPQLPSLTALGLNAGYLSSLDFLQGLPNLASLRCTSIRDAQPADRLIAGLQHCVNATELLLECCGGLTSAHLADLLPRLPRLQSLALIGLSVDSLSFLAQPPMTSQLTALQLAHCGQLPGAEVRRLHELRGLCELHISHSFEEIMDPQFESLMALRPPSAALPLLKSFTYCARQPW